MKRFWILAVLLLLPILALTSCGEEAGGVPTISVTFQTEGADYTLTREADYFNGWAFSQLPNSTPKGHRFEGFFTSDGVKYIGTDGKKVADLIFDRDILLIARFSPLEYTLTMNAGEHSFADGSKEQTVKVNYGETLASFPVPVLTDPAVAFDGWFTEDGTRYSNGAEPVKPTLTEENYAGLAQETKLVAVYAKRVITVTVDYNDGSLETESFTRDYGEALGDLSAYSKDTGSEGVVGWSTNPYTEVAPPETLTENIRLYAIWKPYKNVGFVMPDGETRTEKIFEDTNRITLPALQAPGYLLEGWYLTNSLSGNRVESVHYSNMQEIYYGNWQITDYSISFSAKGEEIADMRYYYGDTVALPAPNIAGYTFYGWYTDNPEEPFFMLPNTVWGDITLTAKLVPNNYSIILHPDGGEIANNFHMVEFGSNFSVPVPTREGYVFLGWYDAPRAGNKVTNQRGVGLAPWSSTEEDKDLYAYWDIMVYNVIFITDGGTSVSPIAVEHGGELTLPKPPKKTGVLFHGWYNEEGTQEYKNGAIITGPTVLYAQWIESTPIFDAEDLLAIKNNPSGNYHLMDDINMGNTTWSMISEFSGILDGQGYKIYNLLLTNSGANNYGMFSVNKGTIRNLNLEEVTYNYNRGTYTNAGILTAQNSGLIENCRITASSMLCKFSYQIQSTGAYSYVGAFAGNNSGIISGCYTNAYIEGHTTALSDWEGRGNLWYDSNMAMGGIAGASSGNIIGCTAEATVRGYGITQPYGTYYPGTSTHGRVVILAGGLVGVLNGGKVELSVARGDALIKAISLGCSGGNYFYSRIGGMIGTMNSGAADRCYAAGTVQGYGNGDIGHTGGFVGVIYNGASITNSYAETLVKGGNSVDVPAGFASYVAGVITDCYANNAEGTVGNGFVHTVTSTGTVRRCFSTRTAFVSGNGGIVDKCFVAVETPSEGATAEKTPAELKSKEFLLDTLYWDEAAWVVDGENYPTLRGLTDTEEEGETAQ